MLHACDVARLLHFESYTSVLFVLLDKLPLFCTTSSLEAAVAAHQSQVEEEEEGTTISYLIKAWLVFSTSTPVRARPELQFVCAHARPLGIFHGG